MNKENKKMAQQRRAKEREKQRRRAMYKKLAIALGIVVIVGVLVFVTVRDVNAPSDTETTAEDVDTTEDTTDTTESTTDTTPTLNTEQGLVVEEGDTVNIDYTGYKDGVAFEGGSTEETGPADLTIGSGTYIDGFEEGLIGHTVGETVDLNLTFPENYQSEELAGQDVVFTVTINGIYD